MSLLFLISCGQISSSEHEQTVEERALGFFLDSLKGQTDLFFQFDSEHGVRIPNLDEEVYENGLFSGWSLLLDNRITNITRPWLDSLSLVLAPDIFEESDKELFRALFASNIEKSRTAIPYTIESQGLETALVERLADFQNQSVFVIEIRHSIEAKERTYVEMNFHRYFDELSTDYYSLYVVFDSKNNVVGWSFR